MRITKKIEAFTLTELLVVLVISIIIIGIAFSALSIINKNYNEYRDWYSTQSLKRDLETQLSIDFHSSKGVKFNKYENRLIFQTFKDSLEKVEYIFYKNMIVTKSDTFNISFKSYSLFFNGKEIENEQVDGVKIIFSDANNDFLFVSKFNSSENLLSDEI